MHDGILQLAGQYDAEISIEGVGAVEQREIGWGQRVLEQAVAGLRFGF